MRKMFLLQGLLYLFALKIFAQPSVPVDPVTGNAQISIPLGAISYGNISVPIVLGYNATGVKPQNPEGSAGMNWDLFVGGQISREVRGLPDDYYDAVDLRRGWLTMNYAQQINDFVFVADDNLGICTDEVGDWTFIRDLQYIKDPEPDLFSFIAPGLNGQFVFGADKLPKLMPYQDLKIEFTPAALNTAITNITITKNDGTKYKFAVTESVTRDANPSVFNRPVTQFITGMEHYRTPLKFRSVWSLQSIESPSGAIVSFCYGDFCNNPTDPDNYESISSTRKNIELSSITSNATSTPFKQYFVQDMVETKRLASITTPAQRVDFLVNTDGQITEVKFSGNGTSGTKNYKLQYIEVKNPSEQYGKRFLKQINESNSFCESFPAFQFEYYDVAYGTSTATTSLIFNNPNVKQDYWGYFNDLAVSRNPTIYYYSTKTNAERYRFYPIPGLTATATINGTNRSVNPAKIVSGSLKKISYPTGGTATVVYEPNDYYDAEASTQQYGPGLRVKQVTIQDNVIAGSENIVYDYEYKMVNNSSSGKWIYRSVFGYHDVGNFYSSLDDMSKESLILYERVKVKRTGRGETVYEYLLPGMYPLTTISDWKATQTKFVRGSAPSCVSYGELRKHYFSHPFAYNTNYDFERGLIYKITEYNSSLQLVQEKEYVYQRLGTPTVVVKGLRFELLKNTSDLATGANQNANTYVYGRYELLANLGKVVFTETIRTPDMSDNTKTLETSTTYNYSTVHRMLKDIVALNSDGNTYKTKFTYAKDFSNLTQPNTSDKNSVMIKKLNTDFMHAAPVETISSVTKSGVETVTGASLSVYGEFLDSTGLISRPLLTEVRSFAGTSGFSQATVTPASGSNQVLTVTAYKPSQYIDKYDFVGNPISTRNIQRISQSVHLGYKKTLPVVQIDNAAADEVFFDGFETYTGRGFDNVSAGLAYPPGWTGKKSVQITTGNFLQRNIIVKGRGTYYRYSCWVNGTAARQITFKVLNGATVVSTGTVSYGAGDVNQWKYFEGRLSVAAANANFSLKVESNGTVLLDDIAFYPESSSISIYSYDPLIGKTSETDSRGVASFYEYDALGKLRFVKDQDKNLRQMVDYYYKVQPYPAVVAGINASLLTHQVVKNVTVNYSATTGNCALSPLTYDWYVNDVKLGNNVTTFSYTYSLEQRYVLRLVVTHPTYGTSASSITYDVKQIGTGPLLPSVADVSGTNSYAFCDASHQKTFNLGLTGCYLLPDVDIKWYYNAGSGLILLTNDNANVGALTPNGLSMTFDPVVAFNGISNLASYTIRCEVSTTCPLTGVTSTNSFDRVISYNGNQQCQ